MNPLASNALRGAAFDIEDCLAKICDRTRMHSWDEDHISYLLMEELSILFSNYRVFFDGWSKIVEWKSYKNRGKIENLHGDIALLLNIQFSTNEVLQGVALLEAKREFEKATFRSLNQTQVNRVLENSPLSQLLLYYRNPIEWPIKWPGSQEWQSSMWVSPLNTVAPLLQQLRPSDNGRIQRVCLPFSMFLTARAFWGLDLDYRQELYKDIAAANSGQDGPDYLGVIDIFYDGQRPIPVAIGNGWEEI